MHADSGNQTLTKIPAHVPPELVYEYDNSRDARLLQDPHARMRSLILEAPPIFYTPYNGGFWVRLDSKSHERSYPTWTYGRGKVPRHGTRWRGQRWADRVARVQHR